MTTAWLVKREQTQDENREVVNHGFLPGSGIPQVAEEPELVVGLLSPLQTDMQSSELIRSTDNDGLTIPRSPSTPPEDLLVMEFICRAFFAQDLSMPPANLGRAAKPDFRLLQLERGADGKTSGVLTTDDMFPKHHAIEAFLDPAMTEGSLTKELLASYYKTTVEAMYQMMDT
ncbi:hypothetical protein K435DRAFT_851143 [Dendrothele bispora CBS 962.96]|uniref:Uncharacterized protein n=1 Tax=Dendrothele bispora (strain CBS 962.96) TaxID=1314807 RepID=A0A4S8MMK1_DENBC|nr:hypothetical protein K435DRAFT_851143 [Dendrothele bispora CBS 962.96]